MSKTFEAIVATVSLLSRLLKNAHLLRFPHPASLRSLQGSAGASLLRISGALHLGIFEQPAENNFFQKLLVLNSLLESFDLFLNRLFGKVRYNLLHHRFDSLHVEIQNILGSSREGLS